jgi:hypothetical protein
MRMVLKLLGWVAAGLLALVGLALTIGKDVAQSLLEDWLGERIDPPSWVNWVVIAGFGLVTLWVVGSALFGSSGSNTDETG